MFVYYEPIVKPSCILYRFVVIGDMVWNVAYLYQSNRIACDTLKPNEISKTMTIDLLNPEKFDLRRGQAYHLSIAPYVDGIFEIKMIHEEDQYVPTWYRMPDVFSLLIPSTWLKLFGSTTPPERAKDEYKLEHHEKLLEEDYVMYEAKKYEEYLEIMYKQYVNNLDEDAERDFGDAESDSEVEFDAEEFYQDLQED